MPQNSAEDRKIIYNFLRLQGLPPAASYHGSGRAVFSTSSATTSKIILTYLNKASAWAIKRRNRKDTTSIFQNYSNQPLPRTLLFLKENLGLKWNEISGILSLERKILTKSYYKALQKLIPILSQKWGDTENCAEVRDNLLDYLYQELPEAKQQTIRRHIDKCRPCSRKVQPVQDLLIRVNEMTMEEMPSLAALPEYDEKEDEVTDSWWRRGSLGKTIQAIAMNPIVLGTCVLAIISLAAYRYWPRTEDSVVANVKDIETLPQKSNGETAPSSEAKILGKKVADQPLFVPPPLPKPPPKEAPLAPERNTPPERKESERMERTPFERLSVSKESIPTQKKSLARLQKLPRKKVSPKSMKKLLQQETPFGAPGQWVEQTGSPKNGYPMQPEENLGTPQDFFGTPEEDPNEELQQIMNALRKRAAESGESSEDASEKVPEEVSQEESEEALLALLGLHDEEEEACWELSPDDPSTTSLDPAFEFH